MNRKWAKRYDELLRQYRCRSYVEDLIINQMTEEQEFDVEMTRYIDKQMFEQLAAMENEDGQLSRQP